MPSTISAGRLFDYINLNPVRKGLMSVDPLFVRIGSKEESKIPEECRPAFK